MRPIAGTVLVLFMAAQAGAQTSDAMLDEVVVTGRKMARAEVVQEAPIAVSAFGAAQLDAAFVRNVGDLSFSAPNVSLDSVGVTPGVQNFAIRGLGLNSSIPSIDPTVGLFVDEMYLGVTYGVVLDMFDLESVEILRGPQGLLFGRNVTGGAVLVRTRRPGTEFGVRLKAAAETGPEYVLAGSVEGPLGSRVAAKLTGYIKDDQGFFDSSATGGSHYGEDRTFFVRPSILFTPSENTEVLLRYEHGEMRGDGAVVQNTQYYHGFDTGVGTEGYTDIRWDQAILETSWKVPFGDGKITNILAWRDLEHDGLSDVDGLPQVLFHGGVRTLQDQLSNELRYAGTVARGVDLTAGVYWFTQDILYREERILSGGAVRSTLGGDQDHWIWAAFVASDVALSDTLTANLGVRYTKEHKEARVATFNALNSPCDFATNACRFDFDDAHDWQSWIPKLGFDWKPRTDLLLYTFWTKGVRSGGYNFRNVNPLVAAGPTEQETQNTFEIGAKSEWADRRLRLNAAYFHNDIDDLQREIVVVDPVAGAAQVIRNSADARIQGAELEAVAALGADLLLTASVGYTDADYTTVHTDLTGDGLIDDKDRALELPRVAPWSYGLGLTYDLALGDFGSSSWRLQYSHRDRAAFTDANTGFLSEVDLLDASVTYRRPDRSFSISLYGKNLTDEDYESAVVPLPFGIIRYLNKGRRYGIEFNLSL